MTQSDYGSIPSSKSSQKKRCFGSDFEDEEGIEVNLDLYRPKDKKIKHVVAGKRKESEQILNEEENDEKVDSENEEDKEDHEEDSEEELLLLLEKDAKEHPVMSERAEISKLDLNQKKSMKIERRTLLKDRISGILGEDDEVILQLQKYITEN